jgi:uncharacterized glyoxalase superfamily protein PhnB
VRQFWAIKENSMSSKSPKAAKAPKSSISAKSSKAPVPAGHTSRSQPEPFRARSFSAALTVNDLQKSVAWYRDAIGFIVGREYERNGKVASVQMKAGSTEILLNQDDGAKGWDRTKGVGVGLYLTTAQSVDDIAKRIKQAGTTLETEPTDMPWGSRAFRVKDPDGFMLAISSERSA